MASGGIIMKHLFILLLLVGCFGCDVKQKEAAPPEIKAPEPIKKEANIGPEREDRTPTVEVQERPNAVQESKEVVDEHAVVSLAKNGVRQYLRVPIDAPLNWSSDANFNKDHTAAHVEGTVKARYPNGAESTFKYGVNLSLDSSGWIVDLIAIDNQVAYERSVRRDNNKVPLQKNRTVEKTRKPAVKQERKEAITRTWTDSEGKHTIEATFGGMIGDKVRLKKTDGSSVDISLDRLSEEDQTWVKEGAKRPY
jgi:hypothetical protein